MRTIRLFIPLLTALLLGAPALSMALEAQDSARHTNCANNLSQLWKMQSNYRVQYGGAHKLLPLETGEAFWLKLSSPETTLIDSSLNDLYQCPVENFDDKGCDYRGPASNVNRYRDGDPVGADVDGNHGVGRGGNVLRKSGDVQTVQAGDRLWKAAEIKTSGGNKAHPPEILEPGDETPDQLKALVQIGQLVMGTYTYKTFNGTFPPSLRGLVERPDEAQVWPEGGFYPGGIIPKDPWGNEYQYGFKPDSETPEIWTWGADGKKGGKGEDQDLDFLELSRKPRPKKNSEKKKANEIKTSSGLKYTDLKVGTGAQPTKGQTCVVHYTGWLENGKKFDSSVDRNRPFQFPVGMGRVIKGWDEGVSTMKVGGKRKLIIPPHLGYGSRGAGRVIPPDATLIFEVELLEVKD